MNGGIPQKRKLFTHFGCWTIESTSPLPPARIHTFGSMHVSNVALWFHRVLLPFNSTPSRCLRSRARTRLSPFRRMPTFQEMCVYIWNMFNLCGQRVRVFSLSFDILGIQFRHQITSIFELISIYRQWIRFIFTTFLFATQSSVLSLSLSPFILPLAKCIPVFFILCCQYIWHIQYGPKLVSICLYSIESVDQFRLIRLVKRARDAMCLSGVQLANACWFLVRSRKHSRSQTRISMWLEDVRQSFPFTSRTLFICMRELMNWEFSVLVCVCVPCAVPWLLYMLH